MCSSGRAQHLGQFLELARLHQLQVVGDDLPGHAAFAVAAFNLQQQALPHILRADAGGIERLHDPQRLLHFFHAVLAGIGDFFERGGEIAVLVQVADDVVGCVAHVFRHHQHAQLRIQVIGEGDGRGKKCLKGRLFHRFRRGAFIAGIQVFIEKRAEVDFVERVLVGFLDRGGFRFQARAIVAAGSTAVSTEESAGPS